MTPEDARGAARRRFGNVTAVRERFYEAGRMSVIDRLVQDLRCAVRNMRRYPVASLVAMLSLAVGIGATTSAHHPRRHLPPAAAAYQHPEELSKIQIGSPAEPDHAGGNAVPVALYPSWRDALGPSIAAARRQAFATFGSGDRTVSVRRSGRNAGALQRPGRRPIAGSHVSGGAASRTGRRARSSAVSCGRALRPASDASARSSRSTHRAHTVIGVMPEPSGSRDGLAHLERAHPRRHAGFGQRVVGRHCAGKPGMSKRAALERCSRRAR